MKKGIYRDPARSQWYIHTRVKVLGEYRTVTIRGYATKAEASADYDRALSRWLREHGATDRPKTFSDLVDEAAADRASDVKAQTLRIDGFIYSKYLLPEFGDEPVTKALTADRVRAWYAKLCANESISVQRRNKIIVRMKGVLAFAYSRLYMDAQAYQLCDVCLKTLRSDVVAKREKAVWTREEYDRFMDAIPADEIWYPLFALFGELGCRIGELQGLQWRDLDEKNGTIHIVRQVVEATGTGTYSVTTPKTSSSIRYNRLNPETVAMLLELRDIVGGRPEQFVFGGDRPRSRRSIRAALYRYTAIAGVPRITPHGIRHSNASWLVQTVETMEDVKVVSNRLGHASTQVTLDTYAHVLKSKEAEMIGSLRSARKPLGKPRFVG